MQLIYEIKNTIKVDWDFVIMKHMQHQQGFSGGLPYARLITRILEHCGIDLKRQPKKNMNANECEINVGAIGRNTGIFKDKDGIYKHKDDSSVNAPPPAPEGGYTNEALYNKLCSVETYMVSGFRELRLEMAFLKSQYQTQNQDHNEDEDRDVDDMDESD